MAWTEEQNQAIFESGKDILVSAGAGSGKTAVLTARVMRIIESGVHINELLVLTFTKAAAAEMKERIRKALKKKVLDNPKLKQELELIDQAYITTFDSFALSVVKKYHYLLNISREISITEESIIEMEKVKIMDEVFDRYYDMEEEGFKKLIYDFCVKDDNELKKLIIKIATKIDGLPNRDEYLSSYMDNYFSEDYIKSCLKEYADLLNIKVVNIKRLALKLSGYLDSEYELKLSLALSPLYNSKLIDDYYNAISVIKLPNLPRGSEDEVKKAKENLSKEVKNLKDLIYTYGNEKRILESIDSIKVYTQVIVQIVKNYLEAFHLYKYKNDIYDFQDIALLSLKVLKENRVVREALKNSFYEIMIDEYQDTNDIQENFIEMIKNNNVYMVGDIKQSIYRFRNANPYIFKSKYDNFAQNIGGLKIDLVKNFRSRKEVLENINIVFNLIMDETIGGAKYRESHQMIFGNNSK